MSDEDRAEPDDVAWPPSAVGARLAPQVHVRNLPHILRPGKTLFLTFNTQRRWILPEPVRQAVMDCCVHDHGSKYALHAAVVMPDHVHLLLMPNTDAYGNTYGIAEFMNGIKGAAAHAVNRALRRRGAVWQPEYFDHVLRSDEDARATAEYICANPLRAGLGGADSYPWIWREWRAGSG
jgi:putative DNA methylase